VENLKLLGARASKSLPADLLEQAAGMRELDEQPAP
jgi:DNA recombination protein RmuC